MDRQYIKRTAYELAIQAVEDAWRQGELLGASDATRAAATERELRAILDGLGAARGRL